MPAYSHLLDEERDQIAVMRAAGRSICAIVRWQLVLGSTAIIARATRKKRQTMIQDQLSHQILPNAATMLGVCLTGVGLVIVAGE